MDGRRWAVVVASHRGRRRRLARPGRGRHRRRGRRRRHSVGPARRATALGLACTIAYATVVATAALGRLAGWDAGDGTLFAYDVVVAPGW